VTYELINRRTANSLASFDSADDARAAVARFAESDRSFAEDLVIVAFDEEGLAVDEVEPAAMERESSSFEPVFRPAGVFRGWSNVLSRSRTRGRTTS
jgi:hypothetical protein